MFKIGDEIIYPLHGIGYIEAIEEKEVLGVNQIYYTIRIPQTNLSISIPSDKLSSSGIRQIADSTVIEEVLKSFNLDSTDPLLYENNRYCNYINKEKIRSGDIYKGTEIIRDLTRKNLLAKLGKEDAKMLEDARNIFISELMQVKNLSKEQANELLDTILAANEAANE